MIKLHIYFSNRTEYAVYTGELYTTYYQGDSIRNICNDDRPIFTEVTIK